MIEERRPSDDQTITDFDLISTSLKMAATAVRACALTRPGRHFDDVTRSGVEFRPSKRPLLSVGWP